MHRGAHVARLTAADVHDLYQVRRLVELSALDSAVEGADLSGMRFAFRALKLAVEQDDMATTVESDLQFHRALADLLGSPRIAELYRAAQTGTRLCLALIDNRYEDLRALVAEHEAILLAIEDRDRERAGRLLSEHLDEAESSIARMIDAANGGDESGGAPMETELQ
jgi:DNA-binding GntR family transcriptional regulator